MENKGAKGVTAFRVGVFCTFLFSALIRVCIFGHGAKLLASETCCTEY